MSDIVGLSLLAGKRILVTGAASGIGFGAASCFQRMGARLAVADRDLDGLSERWGGDTSVTRIRLNVVDEAECEAAIVDTVRALGGLDGVFNSAGISDVVAPAISIDIEDWQRVVDINLRGSFLVARCAGRHMLQQGAGAIILVSSVNGMNGIPRRHAYGPAKAAIAQLARTLACEWGGAGLRVNAIAPTYVRTPMIQRLANEGKLDLSALARRTPMGRIGEVEDIGHAAAFLLSDLSVYITGVVLPVDGGWLAYGGPGDVASA